MKAKNIRIIIDTNVWISFLIGKRLAHLKSHLSSANVTLITTEKLLIEIKEVTKREKLKKYFPADSVAELIELLETIAEKVEIKPTHFVSRDPKDNFLLDLIDFSKADYLITGYKDLLALNPFQATNILSPSEFEIEVLGK